MVFCQTLFMWDLHSTLRICIELHIFMLTLINCTCVWRSQFGNWEENISFTNTYLLLWGSMVLSRWLLDDWFLAIASWYSLLISGVARVATFCINMAFVGCRTHFSHITASPYAKWQRRFTTHWWRPRPRHSTLQVCKVSRRYRSLLAPQSSLAEVLMKVLEKNISRPPYQTRCFAHLHLTPI